MEPLEQRMLLSVVPPWAAQDGDPMLEGFAGDLDLVGDSVETGQRVRLFDLFDGNWADAEKQLPNDPDGLPPGTGDDYLCWAATASNMLEWTGWGIVDGMTNADQIFDYFEDHWVDTGGFTNNGTTWWLDGEGNYGGDVDVPGGGFYPGFNPSTYIDVENTDADVMDFIRNATSNGSAMGISIGTSGSGHAITVWGYNYDSAYDPSDPEYYLGLWVTDSDDNKNTNNAYTAPDELHYYGVSWNSTDNWWELEDYTASTFHIGRAYSLERYFSGDITITGDQGFAGQSDTISVGLDSTGTHLEVYVNGSLEVYSPPAQLGQLNILGWGGNDTLVVDYTNGNPVPAGGLFFDGGAGSDELIVFGDGTNAGSYLPGATAGNGEVMVDGSTIMFTGLEPVLVSGMEEFTLVTPNSNDNLTIDTPSSGLHQISGTSGGVWFEELWFQDVTHFKVDTATNDNPLANQSDTVTWTSDLVGTQLVSFTVETGAGDDTVDASAITSLFGVTLLGGAGDDTLIGGAGDDRIEGNDGQDHIEGNDGADTLLGGADADYINPGTGPDTVDGGAGQDHYEATEHLAYAIVSATTSMSVEVFSPLGTDGLDSIESINLENKSAGPLLVDVFDLTGTSVSLVMAMPDDDGSASTMTVYGSDVADNISVGTEQWFPSQYDQTVTLGWGKVVFVNARSVQGDSLHIQGNDGDDTITADPNALSSYALLYMCGGLGNDYVSGRGKLFGGEGNDILVGSPGKDEFEGNDGDDTIIGNGGNDEVTGGAGTDTILVEGTPGDDIITVTEASSGELVVDVNGLVTTYAETSGNLPGVERLLIESGDGNDVISVASLENITTEVNAGGPTASDTLNVLVPDSAMIAQGAESTSGTINSSTGNVDYTGIEHLNIDSDTGGSTLVVQATDDNDTLTVEQIGPQMAAIWVNDGPQIQLNMSSGNFATLNLDGRHGDDAFSITPILGLSVNVSGGDPTASDSVVINGTSYYDSIAILPTAADAATVMINSLGPVTIQTAESLTINGQGGGDELAIVTPTGADTITYTPGATVDAASVQVNSLIPTNFTNLGAGVVTLEDISGSRVDTLVYKGTSADDTFDVWATTSGHISLNEQLIVSAPGVIALALEGLDGDDQFTIAGNHPFNAISIEGGNPDASDVVNFNSTGGDVTINLDALTISEGSFAPVNLGGVELVNVNASGGNVVFIGTVGDDDLSYKPTATNAGRVELAGLNTLFDLNDVGSLMIDPAGGQDTVVVSGNELSNNISVTRDNITNVLVDGLQSVDIVTFNTQLLRIATAEGDDSITIGNTGGPALAIDGGPSGGADTLYFFNSNPGTTTITPGTAPDAGTITTPDTAANTAFSGIEEIVLIGGAPSDSLVVVGTDADDAFAAASNAVWVNDRATINFYNFGELTLDGRHGDDTFSITPMANVEITVEGDDPTASDNVVVNGTAGADMIAVSPTAADAATVEVNALGPVNVQTVESLTINGQGGGDNLMLVTPAGADTVAYTPGATVDAAGIQVNSFIPIDVADLGAGGMVTLADAGGTRFDTLVYKGTSVDDVFDVAAISGNVSLNSQLVVSTPGIDVLVLEGLDGDDAMAINSPQSYSNILVQGGGPGHGDRLNLIGGAGAEAVAIIPDAIHSDEQNITGLGASIDASGIELITYAGADDDDTLTVNPGGGNHWARVESASSFNMDQVTTDSLPDIEFAGLQTFEVDGISLGTTEATFVTNTLAGAIGYEFAGWEEDTLIIEGADGQPSSSNDNLTVVNGMLNQVEISDNVSSVVVTNTTDRLRRLQINTLGGDDLVKIDVSTGLIHAPITFDGGENSDTLLLIGDPEIAEGDALDQVEYFPGSGVLEGRLAYDLDWTTPSTHEMVIDFLNVEPVVDLVPTVAAVTVYGTNADNAINYTEGPHGGTVDPIYNPLGINTGLVSVDAFETYEFANKADVLEIFALAGDDVINLNNPTVPAGLTRTWIEGGDPTASDKVVVNGTSASDVIVVEPAGANASDVTVNGLLNQIFTAESLTINGQGGGDMLMLVTPAGADTVTYTPGTAIDAASVQVGSLIPTDFADLGALGAIILADDSGTRVDTLVYEGTNADDTFDVAATTGNVLLNSQLVVSTPGIDNLALAAFDGDDQFTVAGNHPFNAISIEGGNPDASDVVNFNSSGGDVTIDLNALTISEGSFAPVNLGGVELVNVNASGGNVVFIGTAGDDDLSYKPTATNAGRVELAGLNTLFDLNNVGGLMIDPAGGQDTVVVSGNELANAINVTRGATTNVAVDGLQSVNLNSANTELLLVKGEAGDDAIHVTGTGGPALTIDGGPPTASDSLVIINTTPGTTTVMPGATPDAGTITTPDTAANTTFSGIEDIVLIGANPTDGLVVMGTDAGDEIAAADYAIWVNDRAPINFANFDNLILHGKHGGDAFSITPMNGVAVTVNGDDPTTSDSVVVNGTSSSDDIVISPTAFDAATVQVNTLGLVTLQTVESLTINGQGYWDDLTLITPAGLQQVNVFPGAVPDSGTVTINSINREAFLGFNLVNIDTHGALTVTDVSGDRVDDLIFNARDLANASDEFILNSAGDVVLRELYEVHAAFCFVQVFTPGIRNLTLSSLAGDDRFNVVGNHPFETVLLDGGAPSASDLVEFNGSGGDVGIDLGLPAIVEDGFNAVYLSGVELANVNALGARVDFLGTMGDDEIEYTPTGSNSGQVELAGLNTLFDLSNVGDLYLHPLLGQDAILVSGNELANTINVTRGATTNVAVDGLQSVNLNSANTELLLVKGEAGDDEFIVSGTGGPALTINGGPPTASDTLIFANTTPGTTTVTPGTTPDAGTVTTPDVAADTAFMGIEGIQIIGADPSDDLVVVGTGANDTISAAGHGVHVNDRAFVSFVNFDDLALHGQYGDDTFSIRPMIGVAIEIRGNDPTASDHVVINGTAGPDAISVSSLTTDGAAVQVGGAGLVTLQTTESLTINGLGGDDALTVVTPTGHNTITYTPGTTVDSAGVQVGSLIPIDFTTLGDGGTVTLNDTSGSQVDTLVYEGTAADDYFEVGYINDAVSLNSQLFVYTPGVSMLTLKCLAGDDLAMLFASLPYTTVFVEGNGAGSSDLLQIVGEAGTQDIMTVWSSSQDGHGVANINGVPVLYEGLKDIHLFGDDGENDHLTVKDNATDNTWEMTEGSLFSGNRLQIDDRETIEFVDFKYVDLINTGGEDLFRVWPTNLSIIELTVSGAGTDTIEAIGTAAADTMGIAPGGTQGSIDVNGFSFKFGGMAAANLVGLQGEDTFNVEPMDVAIFVDGGDPIGVTPGDQLNLFPGPNPVVFETGPESDEGGFIVGTNERVSFDHLEAVSVTGGSQILVLGTNDDDEITIIARDDSTHAMLTGMTPGEQDFTVSVNASPEILFINAPMLYVDALAGDDDIVTRTPAPNQAEWNVEMFVAGGPPAASDRLVLETPGTDTVIFTPTSAETGKVLIDKATNDSTITMGPFDLFWPGPTDPFYSSSPGGIEHFVYDGQSGDDSLTVVGTLGDDAFVHAPGAMVDAGSVVVNSLLPVSYENLGTGGSITMDGDTGYNAMTALGTVMSDEVDVSFSGTGMAQIDLFNVAGTRVPLFTTSATDLLIEVLQGDDRVYVAATVDLDGSLFILGDELGGSDSLYLVGSTGLDENVTITPDIFYSNKQDVTGLGAPINVSGVELINLAGNSGELDTLNVDPGAGDHVARVEASSLTATDLVTTDSLPAIEFTTFDKFVVDGSYMGAMKATFVTNKLSGAIGYEFSGFEEDTLVIEGVDGQSSYSDDNFTVTDQGTSLVEITDNISGVTVTNTIDFLGHLQINTLNGDDLVTVDVGSTDVIDTPITFDGGDGSDLLIVEGTPLTSIDEVIYTPGPAVGDGRLLYEDQFDNNLMTIDFLNLEPVVDLVPAAVLTVNATNAPNAIDYSRGSLAANGMVAVDNFELIEFSNKTSLTIDAGAGNDVVNLDNDQQPTGLFGITVLGRNGDDTVTLENLPAAVPTAVYGGAGDDLVDGSGVAAAALTLYGEAGEDLLIGGSANDIISGGADDDVMIGHSGNNSYDGGDGYDTIGILGTLNNDRIDVDQTGIGTLFSEVNGDPRNDTFTETEAVRVELNRGDDIIRVTHDDSLVATPGESLRMEVLGGDPNASDRLAVVDDGLGDTVIYRKSHDNLSGTITVGPLAPVVFEGIEYVDITPLNQITSGTGTDGLGQLVVFKADPYENNNSLPTATYLGSGATINVDPTVDPGGDPGFGLPGDSDWYQVVAAQTGTLDFQVYFEQIDVLANGRAGLPGDGNLDIELYDVDGTLIAGNGPNFGTNDADDNERIRIPAVAGQTYYLRVFGHTENAVNVYNMTVVNEAPPVPYDIELDDIPVGDPPAQNSDTGRSQFDNITRDTTPVLVFRLDDARLLHDLPGNPSDDTPPDEVISIPFNTNQAAVTTTAGYRVAVYDEGDPQQPGTLPQVLVGYARMTSEGVYEFDFDTDALDPTYELTDGSHFLSAKVEMIDPAYPTQTGLGGRSVSLEIVVDTIVPPVSFGEDGVADDGLHPDSDTGIEDQPGLFVDRITSDTTPSFWGIAEADAIVRLYVDLNGNLVVDAGDLFLGETMAVPLDGSNQFPRGQWNFTTNIDMNDPAYFAIDGLRTILVTAEDVAGNVNEVDYGVGDNEQLLQIFVDTRGPQVDDVYLTDDTTYDLFDPKPSENGPTPLVYSISIDFIDRPIRVDDSAGGGSVFVYPAVNTILAELEAEGHYVLVGDANGIIPIDEIIADNSNTMAGDVGQTTVLLKFSQPLPDDRYTLTILDNIMDDAGNALDGETNTAEPQENPTFPSGDGQPGENFIARFTIDSRPEIGVYAAGSVWVDTNGNYYFDSDNLDYTNRDIVYTLAYTSDNVFAGNFAELPGDTADGFDKLAAYGRVNNTYRWLIDTDNDGVPNLDVTDPAHVNGMPVAGNFDGNTTNGDEVALFTGSKWWLDTNHDFMVDTSINSTIVGYPIVGDFDGDGLDDLGAWTNDTFSFDLAFNGFGQMDAQITDGFAEVAGFIGVREQPVAADMDQDGIDDIGLWVPDRSGVLPAEAGEWYFLISDDHDQVDRVPGTVVTLDHSFSPTPLGNDIQAQFGDEYALPVVGNFDPPVTNGSGEPIASTVGLSATLVATPTATDTSGAVSSLPESQAWVDEWSDYWIEIWVDTSQTNGERIADAVVDLQYDTQLATATDIEFGPSFFKNQTGAIDDAAGVVDALGASASSVGITADGHVLLARVRFEVTTADQGLALDDDQAIASTDCGIALTEGRVTYTENGYAGLTLADPPTTEIWPVMYDLDDDGEVGLGDLSYFAAAYGQLTGTAGVSFSHACDFDRDGEIGLGDLSYFAAAYGRSRLNSDGLPYDDQFPADWNEPVMAAGSALPPDDTEGAGGAASGTVLNASSAESSAAASDQVLAETYATQANEEYLRQESLAWTATSARRRAGENQDKDKNDSTLAIDLLMADDQI